MMPETLFDFSRAPDRRGSDSVKWRRYAGRDILPLWVADMDFAAPPAVIAALHERVAHGVFGYGEATETAQAAVVAACARDYDWAIEADWIVWLPGLVTGLNLACRALCPPQRTVVTATPVYPPFLSAPALAGRRLTRVALREDGWGWDFAALETIADPGLLLLCHPHNPVGRIWREDELAALGQWALEKGAVVCSDEIHCDLLLAEGVRHRPFAALSPALAARSLTLMAPSKTYNVPGLACAFAIVPDPGLRRLFRAAMRGIVPDPNVLGLAACTAAYTAGAPWRAALLAALRERRDTVCEAVAALPGLSMSPPEATYLAWIDARGLEVADPVALFEAAGVGLSNGADFGAPGFVRLNFGCPPATLDAALARMRAAVAAPGGRA